MVPWDPNQRPAGTKTCAISITSYHIAFLLFLMLWEKRSHCSNYLNFSPTQNVSIFIHSFQLPSDFGVYSTLLSLPNHLHLSILLHLTSFPLRECNNIKYPFTTPDLSFPSLLLSNFFPTPFLQNTNKLLFSPFKSNLFRSSTSFSSIYSTHYSSASISITILKLLFQGQQ